MKNIVHCCNEYVNLHCEKINFYYVKPNFSVSFPPVTDLFL